MPKAIGATPGALRLANAAGRSAPSGTVAARSRVHASVLALPVTHPDHRDTPLWLVVCRSKGRTPWYLLTAAPITTAEDAWHVVFAYARRWATPRRLRGTCHVGRGPGQTSPGPTNRGEISSPGLTDGCMASPLNQGVFVFSCLHTGTLVWRSLLLPTPRLTPWGHRASVCASSLPSHISFSCTHPHLKFGMTHVKSFLLGKETQLVAVAQSHAVS